MEKFYKTRELVAFCCSDGSNFPSPEDYLSDYFDEKRRTLARNFQMGVFMGLYGILRKLHRNIHIRQRSQTRSLVEGVEKGDMQRRLCEWVARRRIWCISKSWNSIQQMAKKYKTVCSSVFYRKGVGYEHVHESSEFFCPFECSFMGMTLREPHRIEWKFSKKTKEMRFKITSDSTEFDGVSKGMEKGCQTWNSLWCWSELLPDRAIRMSPKNPEEGICFVVP